MSWIEKIKKVVDDIMEPTGSTTTRPVVSGFGESQEDGPPDFLKKSLEKGASLFLSGTKKIVDLVVQYIRPDLQIDFILNPRIISHIFEISKDTKINLSAHDLIILGCNSVQTVGLARKKYAEVVEALEEKIIKLRLKKEKSGLDTEEEVRQAIQELTFWTDPTNPRNRLLVAVESVSKGNIKKAVRLALQIREKYPDFNNPVLTTIVIDHAEEFRINQQELRVWYKKALYYYPLDKKLLMGIMRLSHSSSEKRIYEQILELTSNQ